MKKILSFLAASAMMLVSATQLVFAKADFEEKTPKLQSIESFSEFHVSPNGDDNNDGSYQNPFKTLEGAKNYISTLDLTGVNEDIKVIFHEGEYVFDKAVEFNAENSGTANSNIIYMAAEGKEVVFSGARRIPASKLQTVTNEAVLSKLNDYVRGKLVSVKLTDCGIAQLPAMNTISLYSELYNGMEYVALFNNGKEQPLSQWPNGDDEYVSWIEATDKGDAIGGKKGGTFVYEGNRPANWKTNVSDIWVAGYPGYNYRYERNSVKSINTQTNEITLATPTCFGLINKETKPWKAFNILEEIDIPGEWYIDRIENMLYYYRTDKNNTNLELSILDEPFIKLNSVENVEFSGIRFSKSRKTGIEMKSVKNIDITDCSFNDIGTDAISMSGTAVAKTDSSYTDAASDCTFSGNIFYNIGGNAAQLYGGNVDTLTGGNVEFINNYVFGSATKIKNREMITVYGCGNTVSNNNISSSSFQAIRYYGNNHNISNNEIYNINKASDDAGVIYAGRNYIQRGSVLSYNFLHDSNPIRNKSRGFATGIYWDDSQAGQYAHHNIIQGVNVGAYACGQDNRLENNIFIDCAQKGIMFTNTYEGSSDRKTREQNQYNAIADKDLYNSTYKNLSKGLTTAYLTKNFFNTVKNNLTVNSGTNDIYKNTNNTISNNSQVSACNDFNAPDSLDYRVKEGSTTAKAISGILTTTYDIDNIGNTTDIFTKASMLAEFEKYSGVAVGNDVILNWSGALGANRYRLVVSTDKAMKNKVIDTVLDYPYYETDELDVSAKYYWNVYAINTSREYAKEWECSDGVTELNFEPAENDFESLTEFKTSNLLANGGFENGLDGWVTDDSGVFEVVESTFKNPNGTVFKVINGTKALKATVTSTNPKGYIYKELDVNSNTNYVLNLSWFHLSNTKGSVKVYGDSVSSENLLANVGNIFGGEIWYSSTATFNSGECEKIIIRIDIFNPDTVKYPALYFCVDNITLKAAGNTQTIDFEKGYPEDFNIRSSDFEVTDEKAYEGKYSIKLTSGSGYPLANMVFALNPNRHYAVMFYYYIESGALGYASKHAHENGWSGYTTSPIRTQTLRDSGEWKRAIVTPDDGVTGSMTNSFVELAFQNMAPNTVVYIDNITCKYYDESVSSISITSETGDGGWLNAVADAYNYGYGFADTVSYQWQSSEDKKVWADIEGAEGENYRLTSADSQKYLRVKVNTSNRYSAAVIDTYYSEAVAIGDVIADSVYALTDSDGKTVNKLSEITDGKLNVDFTLRYLSTQAVQVIGAVYDNAGVLQSAKIVNTEAVKNTSEDFGLEFSLPADKDLSGYNFRTYIWDENNRPLIK